jgi:hypothetical protein
MTKWTKSTIALLLVLLVAGLSVLWRTPWGLRQEGAMDITSGDYRYRVYFCGIPVKSEIEESSLSREVRRLGIAVPAKRQWRRMWRYYGGVHSDSCYGFAMGHCDELVSLFERTNAGDEERRDVLGRLMTALRTQERDRVMEEVRLLIMEVGDKHNLHVFTPKVEEYYRSLLKDRQTK